MNKLVASLLLVAGAAWSQQAPQMNPVSPTLPTGVQGVQYIQQFVVSPTGTYSYAVTAGALPPGLGLNVSGALTGIPSSTGTFTFTVTGSAGVPVASRAYTLQINPPLVITTASLPGATVGAPYTATLTATGGVPPTSWFSSQLPQNGLSLNSSTGVISGTPTAPGTITFQVTAADNVTTSPPASLSIVVSPAAPLSITTASLPEGAVGLTYSAALGATGGQPPYSWSYQFVGAPPAGLTFGSNGQITGTPTAAGTFTVNATVQDGTVGAAITASRTFQITIRPQLSITTTFLPGGNVGQAYSATLAATGGLAPYVWSYQFSGPPPPGLTFGTNGQITGTPTTTGFYSVNVSVRDSATAQQTSSGFFFISIAPPPLTVTTTALPDGAVGRGYTAAFAATGGFPPYTWSFQFAPAPPPGLTFASNGQVTGTPTTAGTYTISVTVRDSEPTASFAEGSGGNLAVATATVQLVIRPQLSITTTSVPTATRTQPYTVQMQASGGTTPYTWGADTNPINSVAPGLTIASNGVISGTPTTAGTFNAPVFVSDAGTGNASQSAGITLPVRVFDPLVITTTSLPAGVAGVAYTAPLAVSGGEPGYTWSLASGTLPPGLALSAAGVISGTPTASGTVTLQIRAIDSRAVAVREAIANLTLTIGASLSFTAPNPLPPATLNQPYSFQFTPSGGIPPYVFSLISGALPEGLTLSPSGLISGTPRVFGTFSIGVRLRDSATVIAAAADSTFQGAADLPNLAQVDQQFTLEVRPTTLSIVTLANLGTIEDGQTSLALQAAGGVPPYTWSILSGSVAPTGMTLSAEGILAGFPSPGTYRFTAQVTDRSNQSSSREFVLTVTERRLPLQIITVSIPDGNVGRIYAAVFEARGGARPYSWSISGLPPGINGDRDGNIVGTPQRAGTSTLTVVVTDSNNVQTTGTFTLVIRPGNIIIEPSSAPEGTVDTPYALQFSATGGLPRYRFSVSGTTPPGLTFTEGSLAGTPTEAGNFTFTVEAVDEADQRGQRGYTLVIRPAQLSITTATAPDAQTGVAYNLVFAARGGTRPYRWSSTGTLPPGLALDAATGAITGTPTTLGTFNFSVQVADSNNASANRAFTITVRPRLEITGTLPGSGVVGTALSGSLGAAGGVPPYRWSVTGDTPPGTAFADGALSGTPTADGSFSFTVQLRDANDTVVSRAFTVEVVLPVNITSQVVPTATLGAPFNQTLGVTGGRPPYRWTGSGFPPGISISTDGTISGTPTQAGTFPAVVNVSDSSQPPVQSSRTITIEVGAPTVPSVTIGGLPATTPPAQQTNITLSIGAPFPSAIQGTMTLTFAPDAVNNADDPAIQFSTGGRGVSFTIPAGSTQATFPAPNVGVQTGTVAGTITLTIALNSGGAPVTCDCPLTRTIRIERAAPVITNVRVTRTAGGLSVVVTGFATSREVTQGIFRFGGTNLQSSDATVNVNQVMTTWFQSEAGRRFGSQFVLTMPFTIQGDPNTVNSVSVTLSNSVGSSQPASANF